MLIWRKMENVRLSLQKNRNVGGSDTIYVRSWRYICSTGVCSVWNNAFLLSGHVCEQSLWGHRQLRKPLVRSHSWTYDFTVNGHIPSGYSFPSGHTTSSFAAATVIIIRKEKFAVFTAVLAFLIAFSRLYNCVHYPTDVICGAVLGIALAIITCLIFKNFGWDNRLNKKIIRKKGDVKWPNTDI